VEAAAEALVVAELVEAVVVVRVEEQPPPRIDVARDLPRCKRRSLAMPPDEHRVPS
jgi:hypothetical protein